MKKFFACPRCDGKHFSIDGDGKFTCVSPFHASDEKEIGCGWVGKPKELAEPPPDTKYEETYNQVIIQCFDAGTPDHRTIVCWKYLRWEIRQINNPDYPTLDEMLKGAKTLINRLQN